ncbi:MAG: enoyl-CoA hydratase-related protein [Pseudomonadota bacterium]
MAYTCIKTDVNDHVALITLDRPEARNALNSTLIGELADAVARFDADDAVRVMVLTGDDKAFAAGADITEMREIGFVEAFKRNILMERWDAVARARKPTIAAVAGYALGGGCELAMMCDIIYCADSAKFGQPEINLGVLPALGGSQRLTHLVGKSKAMEMCLSGRFMLAEEAERSGLAARVFPAADLLDEVLKIAGKIAEKPPLAALAVKECVNRAYDSTLSEGLLFEKRMFHALFGTEDKREGMDAFVENRSAQFRGK